MPSSAALFDQAGHLQVASVARWDGAGWDAMAGGVRADQTFGQVFAMIRLGQDLYVTGSFQTAGGAAANNIARWDGTAWSPARRGRSTTPATPSPCSAGRLYVGGTFNVAGRVRANHLACWDPATSTWSAVGNSPRYDDDIRALAAIDDRWLVIGGTFQRFFDGNTTVLEGLWGMVLFDTTAPPTDDLLTGYHPLEGTSRYGGPGLGERAAGAGQAISTSAAGSTSRGSWRWETPRAPASPPTTSRSGTSRRAAPGSRAQAARTPRSRH